MSHSNIQPDNIPIFKRFLFKALVKVYPEIKPLRVWHRLDIIEPINANELLEKKMMNAIEKYRKFMASGMVLFFCLCIYLVWGMGPQWSELLNQSLGVGFLVPILMGVIIHGAFILIVHEATHFNIFQSKVDRTLGNIALGLMLLPFFSEGYQHTHYIHHHHANTHLDNNWTKYREKTFRLSRILYVLYELIPVLNNLDRLADKVPKKRIEVLISWLSALIVIAIFQPGWTYYLLLLFGLNAINALRLWVEHYGHYTGRVSNTYWCPFSFGIANHEIHHDHPRIPALVLMVGLWFRKRDVTIFSAPYRVLFDKNWTHFRTQQKDFSS